MWIEISRKKGRFSYSLRGYPRLRVRVNAVGKSELPMTIFCTPIVTIYLILSYILNNPVSVTRLQRIIKYYLIVILIFPINRYLCTFAKMCNYDILLYLIEQTSEYKGKIHVLKITK